MKPLAWLGAIVALMLILTAGIVAIAPLLAAVIVIALLFALWQNWDSEEEEKPPK